jgi:hypothetical protein
LLNIVMLLLDLLGQMGEISHGAVDLAPGILKVGESHQRRRPRQTPASPLGNGQDQIQIAQEFVGQRRRLGLNLMLCFQKQIRGFQNALAD